jgi:SAM-dependent methyltransferase
MNELHLDRARAESFGSIAEQYDRYRPAAPSALIDALATSRPAQALDVACGTGQVAVALASRGLSVLGVELDPRMAAIARSRGIDVEVGAFETWGDRGRAFDLITCGNAWHWIDPVAGVVKAAQLLRVGGTFARFWSFYVLDESILAAFDVIYREHAPDTHPHGRGPIHGNEGDLVATSDAFSGVEIQTYPWETELTADEWIGLVSTYSDHQRLGPHVLAKLGRALHAAIEARGGSVHAQGRTYSLFARRI